MAQTDLPSFTEHDENQKRKPLESLDGGVPEPVVTAFLDDARAGRPSQAVRVLDVGCGRGARVAWLCEAGWNAWGADISAAYIAAGASYFGRRGWGSDRIRLMTDGRLPFDASSFDIVVSDQVIEHVADLDKFVAEVARVSRPAAVGLHVFPATFRPLEPHLRQPFVHLLPKGPARRAAIRAAVLAGIGVNHFSHLGRRAQADIYIRFSETETYYRRLSVVTGLFEAHGLKVDKDTLACVKMRARLGPSIPRPIVRAAGLVYTRCLHTYLTTTAA